MEWISLLQLAVSFLVLLVLWLCAYEQGIRSRHALKGPRRLFLVGSHFEVVKNFNVLHDWLRSYFSDDCRTIAVDWGTFYNILTVDPANVEHILKSNFGNYGKGERLRQRTYELLGEGIFAVDGELWKRHRKIASHEFSSRKLRHYSAQVFKKHAVHMMEVLDKFVGSDEGVDFQDICLRMTLDSICEVGFGMNMNTLSPKLPAVQFATSFDRAAELLVRRIVGPIWKAKRAFGVGTERELAEHVKVVDTVIANIIRKRRDEMELHSKAGKAYERQDLLSRFMDSNVYQERELRDSVVSFLLAGRDTTAASLSWFIFCICQNPRVAECIDSEMARVMGSSTGASSSFQAFADLLTPDAIAKLHYLRAAISETIRLYPPVPRDGKHARGDDVLPDGTRVKKGDEVAYVPYSMGRMKFLWGDDATEFKPERWLKDSVFQAESPFKFTAFQAGPRICLGKDSAYLQMMITAALLMRFFRFEMVKGQTIHYNLLLVMTMRNGIRVKVCRR